MFRSRNRAVGAALLTILVLVLAACSATGGKRAAQSGANVVAGHASTPHYTIAMITHAGPGQSFWDTERYGGVAAATKDNFTLRYSSDPDPTKQATLIEDAINSKVNGIAVTMFNAGSANWQQCGAMEYFGQDETIAGVAAGKRLAASGKKNVLCVLHAQGQVQLEDRCAGVKQGLGSEGTMTKLYVNGESPSDELSTMTAALTKDKTVDAVITLDAQVALNALQALSAAHSTAKLYSFDTNAQSIAKIKSGAIQWAVDQQPYLQGYEAVDSLWLYLTNGNVIGGGQVVLTGPSFVDASNVDAVAKYAARGTR